MFGSAEKPDCLKYSGIHLAGFGKTPLHKAIRCGSTQVITIPMNNLKNNYIRLEHLTFPVLGECHAVVIDNKLVWVVEIIGKETDYGEDNPSCANILAQDLNFLGRIFF